MSAMPKDPFLKTHNNGDMSAPLPETRGCEADMSEECRRRGRERAGMSENGQPLFARIYAYVMRVPAGTVVTYGQVAAAVGAPRCARQVGWALHQNPQPGAIPCHRVVNREGRLAPAFAFGGAAAQAALLEQEGVAVADGYVDLERYRWRG